MRVDEGRLILFEPMDPGARIARPIYLAEGVHSFGEGPWTDKADEDRAGSLRADFEAFTSGNIIGIAREPCRAKIALLAQLSPTSDEVWEIRNKSPRPGIRVFGRFMGVYNDEMSIPCAQPSPASPVGIQISIFSIVISDANDPLHSITLHLLSFPGGKKVFEHGYDLQKPVIEDRFGDASQSRSMFLVQINSLPICASGYLEAWIDTERESMLAGRLMITFTPDDRVSVTI